jgi:hypothetical protein
LIQSEEHIITVSIFKNKMQKRKYEPNKEVTGGWKNNP